MKRKLDTVCFGILSGLLLPLLFGFLFVYSTWHGDVSWQDLFVAFRSNGMIVKFLCIALFPDMGGVFLLNTFEMWNACKGMFAALGIYMLFCGVLLIINGF